MWLKIEDADLGVTEQHMERTKSGTLKQNPMPLVYGAGPEDKKCRDCAHFYRVGGVGGRYYKCDLRHQTSGPATDHRALWPTCGKFEAAE
jgi:hypothetical protein